MLYLINLPAVTLMYSKPILLIGRIDATTRSAVMAEHTLLFKSLGPDNFMFSMKTHQMSCKMNRKYSQDIDEVRNNGKWTAFI